MRVSFSNTSLQTPANQLQRLIFRLLLLVVGVLSFLPAAANTAVNFNVQSPSATLSDQTDILYAGLYIELDWSPTGASNPANSPIEESRESEFPEEEDFNDSKTQNTANFTLLTNLQARNLIGQQSYTTSSRTNVPYYILFHSWKNFLS